MLDVVVESKFPIQGVDKGGFKVILKRAGNCSILQLHKTFELNPQEKVLVDRECWIISIPLSFLVDEELVYVLQSVIALGAYFRAMLDGSFINCSN